jgi:flagellar hook protein FlgE
LTFDSTGNLVDANGGLIQGYTAGIKQTETTIESAAGMGNVNPLVITKSAYVLNDLDTSAISNININPNMTIPPAATTTMTFTGNLDAAQQAGTGPLATNNNGGVLQQFNPAGTVILPTGLTAAGAAGLPQAGTVTYNAADTVLNPVTGEFTQAANLSITANGAQPVVTQGVGLDAVVADDTGTYAWEQQNPPVTPALTSQQTVYDSNGDARTVTILMYQVNDLGAAGVNAAAGPSQTMYAWYAFDTTGGAAVSTANLVGGTGIIEGEGGPVAAQDLWLRRVELESLAMLPVRSNCRIFICLRLIRELRDRLLHLAWLCHRFLLLALKLPKFS